MSLALQLLRHGQQKSWHALRGERNRVHMARMLREGPNLLCLDEPTNDLDVNTMRALEDTGKLCRLRRWSSATIAGSWTCIATHIQP
jgi:ATPase subunit of ABC transporter with duplicated ATPase domains